MKKIILFLAAAFCLTWIACACCAEEAELLGTWYYASYEDSDKYPGIVFTADGEGDYFSVFTDGERLMLIDSRDGRKNEAREAALEDGVLTAGWEKFTLEDGKLVLRYGSVTETFTREPQERQIPADRSGMYAKSLRPEHFNGTWTITKYGTRNAFADAETMNIIGKAVIEDGKITVSWTRNGKEKSFERTFDEELNRGCLYTVVDDTVSYIVSMKADHTLLLTIGLEEVQWVMRRENVIDETPVHPDAPGFEQAFAGKEDWSVSEESREELAVLLLRAALADGVDPTAIRADSPIYLGLISKDPGFPILICEGTGEYKDYLLTVGRGVKRETGEPFVYYHWTDCFVNSLAYPEKTIAEYYKDETLHLVCGDKIWSVRAEN